MDLRPRRTGRHRRYPGPGAWIRAAWIRVIAGILVTAVRPLTATPAFAVARRPVRRPGPAVRGLRAGGAGERDRVAGAHPVEQVQVRQGLQAARRLPAERARRLVLLRPGQHAGMPGQGLRRGQVTAGQPHRARLLAEHRHPRPLPLRPRPAPLRHVRRHRQGGPPRQPLHLEVRLARHLARDQRLRPRRLIVAQRLERRYDQLRLRQRQGAIGEQAADRPAAACRGSRPGPRGSPPTPAPWPAPRRPRR